MKNSINDGLLKAAIALCIVFAFANAVSIIYAHTPPFDVGQCFSAPRQGVIAKVVKNHIVYGYSEIYATSAAGTQEGPIAFSDLRNPVIKPTECPK